MKYDKEIYLAIGITLGVLIMLAPTMITGNFSSNDSGWGPYLISDFVIRTSALTIGILVIYDSVKSHSK